MRNKIIQLILIIFAALSTLFSQENLQPFKWQIGEELTYKVSWGFVRLGTLRLSIVDTAHIDGVKTYHTRLNIDSNPWIFIISMHSQFDSYLTPDTFSRLFLCEENIKGDDYKSVYQFDYENNILKIHYEDVKNKDKKIDTTIVLSKKLQDGMSIVFYARANCVKSAKENLDIICGASESKLTINFTGKKETIEVTFSKEKIPSLYINGEAYFESIAGFGGIYEAWFSADTQHVPLKVKMKVFIGSVTLELEEWKNWYFNH